MDYKDKHPRTIVELNPDHPGFRDQEYRRRRNEIAQIAIDYVSGDPIPYVEYTDQEHEVWGTVWQHLRPGHEKAACSEYLKYFDKLELPTDHIPQLRDITERTQTLNGFRMEPVAGLVSPREFLSVLADRIFSATQYIRHYSTPLYTPEPDIVHEILGHACTFASPAFTEMNEAVGRAVNRTKTEEGIDFLARTFWFTLEFGVVMEHGIPKAYGAGLLSSAGELGQFHERDLRPMDFRVMGKTDYDVTKYQPILFYAESFDDLQKRMNEFHNNWTDDFLNDL